MTLVEVVVGFYGRAVECSKASSAAAPDIFTKKVVEVCEGAVFRGAGAVKGEDPRHDGLTYVNLHSNPGELCPSRFAAFSPTQSM